ncbi:hypothetical protein A5482_007720 [Cyanobacterium sp. IPPAS B-1200]|uniref:hypothetical protein n=1 Tax=Cyanobacterium sp. IPPAS B-1200 TaxID=1562720 RepID=UPI001372DF77|nr:hypothetical protein [Cyanobacterium sp. IPPAS B-1200]
MRSPFSSLLLHSKNLAINSIKGDRTLYSQQRCDRHDYTFHFLILPNLAYQNRSAPP